MAVPVSSAVLPSSADVLGTLQLICEANAAAYVEAANSPSHRRIIIPASAQPFVKSYGSGRPEPLTWFHSRQVPAFTLDQLSRSLRHPNWSFDEGSSLMAAVLMVRFSETTGLALTALMMHRLFLAASLIVAKQHHDVYPRNADFATGTGMQLAEMNRLEWALMTALDWRTCVTAADVHHVAAGLDGVVNDAIPMTGDGSMSMVDSTDCRKHAAGDFGYLPADVKGVVSPGALVPTPSSNDLDVHNDDDDAFLRRGALEPSLVLLFATSRHVRVTSRAPPPRCFRSS